MRAANQELIDYLSSETQGVVADLYTFTTRNGGVAFWTSWESPLNWGGRSFVPAGSGAVPVIERKATRVALGLRAETLDVVLRCGNSNAQWDGKAFQRAALDGHFDGARLLLQRAYMATPPNIVGVLSLFEGRVEVEPSSSRVKFTVYSDVEGLAVPLPRMLIQPTCGHALYDAGCGANRAAFRLGGVVQAGSDRKTIYLAAALPYSAISNYFGLGVITFLDGVNRGLSRGIDVHQGTTQTIPTAFITLPVPLPVNPGLNDAFEIFPGCDKTEPTCRRFGRIQSFRGFPGVPRPEQARGGSV